MKNVIRHENVAILSKWLVIQINKIVKSEKVGSLFVSYENQHIFFKKVRTVS